MCTNSQSENGDFRSHPSESRLPASYPRSGRCRPIAELMLGNDFPRRVRGSLLPVRFWRKNQVSRRSASDLISLFQGSDGLTGSRRSWRRARVAVTRSVLAGDQGY